MNFFIDQQIIIHMLKVGGVSNSSVLQIGSSGIIKSSSHLYNTGGFTGPAPPPQEPIPFPVVPLPPPTPA